MLNDNMHEISHKCYQSCCKR